MKKIKILILIFIIIVLTGCDSQYNLKINKDLTVKEEAKLSPDSEFLIEADLTYSEYVENAYTDDYKSLLTSKSYKHELSPNKNAVLISKEYKSLSDYAKNTYAIFQFFEDIDVTESNGKITFKTGKFLEQDNENLDNFYINSLAINISSDYKFDNANTTNYNENTNTYTWYISSDLEDYSIEFVLDTSDKFVSERTMGNYAKILYTLLFIIGLWILVLIVASYRKNKPEYY